MQYWSLEKQKERKNKKKCPSMNNGHLCQTPGWHIANKMVNVWAMKLNLCSLLKAWPKLLSSLAGSLYVLGRERKVMERGGTCKRHFQCFTKYQACINLKSFDYLLFHLVWGIACSILFFIANQLKLQYFYIWLSGDKTMFDLTG